MRRPWLLWLLFTISGATGLCFELLFTRQLGVTLGVTSRAVTIVVATFMGGLALGNAAGARLVTRVSRPALVYGVVELGIGAAALVSTWLLPELERFDDLGVRYALAVPLVLVPSILMGATYPLVCEAGASRGGRDGQLYATNTIGAAVGCVLVGFLGIGLVGVRASATIAAAGNVLCGVLAVAMLGAVVREQPAAGGASTSVASASRATTLVAFGCGASALGAEVLWTRALLPYLNSSTYAFAAILAVFLLFVAMGAAFAGARSASWDVARTRFALAAAQLALGVALASSIALMDVAEHWVAGYAGVRNVMSLAVWLATVGSVLSRVVVVIGIPTFLMGASFSLYLRLAEGETDARARVAGRIAGWNTLGGILGSVVAGFVLLPRVGVLRGLLVCGALNVAISILIASLGQGRLRAVGRSFVCAAIGVGALGAALAGRRVPFVGRLAEGGRLVLVDEGVQDTTAVVDVRVGRRVTERTIFSNGISYTGDNLASRRYMRLLGHLPVLLADDPAHSLVICVGTGMTGAAVARYADVRTLDLVDISPVVRRTLPLFSHVNARVDRDTRVRLHEADGRHFVGLGHARFGVISLEPPPPRAAGAASLYTEELYRRARAHMTRGGALAQWLPMHGLSEVELRILARTFVRVFPDARLFVLNESEAALLGSPSERPIDLGAMRRRLGEPGIDAALAEIGFRATNVDALADQLLALQAAEGRALREALGPGPTITDDRPLVEQFAVTLGEAVGGDENAQRRRFLARFTPDGAR